MSNLAKRKTKRNLHQKNGDVNFKIEVATATLERNISFIVTCDNKASIALTVSGVLITVFLTNNEVNNLFMLTKYHSCGIEFYICLYLLLLIIGILCITIGLTKLICVLLATIDLNPKDLKKSQKVKSRIFFAGINRYESLESYKSDFIEMNQQVVLEELIREIYINADIATQKYRKFNVGLKLIIIGFIILCIVLILGLKFL